MLRASRRVLRPGGRTAFLTIEPAPGLTTRERRRAVEVGPPAVAVRTSYLSLLRSAGFSEIGSDDRTDEYRTAQAAWIEAVSRREAAIRPIMGGDAFDERLRDRQRALAAIDEGLLIRVLYWASRPSPASRGRRVVD